MMTHDLAKALNTLSRLLRAGPNVPLEQVDFSRPLNKAEIRDNAPVALAMLAGLSEYSKAEWIALIQELGLSVSIKPTDSTRDLLGRLLKHINDNQAVRDRLAEQGTKKANVSPELMRALSILMKK